MKISKQSAMHIATEISELIKHHINIMDNTGYIIASTNAKRIGTFHAAAKQVICEGLEKLIVEDDYAYVGTKKGVNLPIYFGQEIIGVIGVTGEREQVEMYGKIIKKMTEILVVDAYIKQQKLLEEKSRDRYLEEWLFDSHYSMNKEFIERGEKIGIDITVPRRIFVVSIVKTGLQGDVNTEQTLLDVLEKTIKKILSLDDLQNFFIKSVSKMICIVTMRDDHLIERFARRIIQEIYDKYNIILAVGVDYYIEKNIEGYMMIHKAYIEAEKALAAAVICVEPTVKFYKDITFEIFIDEIPKQVKREFIKKIFKDCSAKEIDSWVNILKVFIEMDGAIGLASKQLFMHKNTLQYKLNKLYEKTGHDARKLKDVSLFLLAIAFWEENKL